MDINSKQNLNLFDDLSKTYSGMVNSQTNNTQNNQAKITSAVANTNELSFQNVKQKIGFKRKNNELVNTNTNKTTPTNDVMQTQIDKKFKKN
jgi:hypothetical protein